MEKCSNLSHIQKEIITVFQAKGGSISEIAEFVNCLHTAMVNKYHA